MTDPLFLALLVVLPLVIIVAILWQRELHAMSPLAVGLNGVPIVLNGTNVRIEQIIGVVLTMALAVGVLLGQRRLFLDRTAKWLAVVAFLHFLASALYSPARFYSLQQSASLLAVWSLYLVVINYTVDEKSLERFFRVVIASGFLYGGLGIAAFMLGRLGFDVGGANVDATAAFPYGAFGTLYEPNIFGSYCAGFFVVAAAMIVLGGIGQTRVQGWPWALLAVAGLGLMLSFTRGAWLGALAALGVVLLTARRYFGVQVRLARLLIPVAVVSLLAVVFWYLPFEGTEFFRYKVRNLFSAQSDNAAVRLLTAGLALEQFSRNPLLGWGTFSFAPLTTEGLPFKEFEGWHALWISNFLLQVLHDTGVVGLVAFIGMLWSLLAGGHRIAHRMLEIDVAFASRHLAVLAAFVGLLVAFLFTTGVTLGYTWMFAGLLGAFARVGRDRLARADHASNLGRAA